MSKHDPTAPIILLISSAFFASGYLLAKGYNPAAGLGMLIWQALLSAAVVSTIATLKIGWKMEKSHIAPVMINGLLSPLILLCVWRGAMVVTPALASTVVVSNAILIAAISWALGRKQFSAIEVGALLTGFTGVVWIGLQRGVWGGEASGIAFLILASILIATMTTIIERPAMEAGGAKVTRWALWTAFCVSFTAVWLTGHLRFYSIEQSALAVLMGGMTIGISVTLFNIGMGKIGAADAASFKLSIPFFSLVYGIIFLHETPGPSSALGALLVIFSLATYQYAGARKRKTEALGIKNE